jgi:hypothetical protein
MSFLDLLDLICPHRLTDGQPGVVLLRIRFIASPIFIRNRTPGPHILSHLDIEKTGNRRGLTTRNDPPVSQLLHYGFSGSLR